MLKKTLLAVAVLLVVFLVVVATRPDRYHVERTKTVSAPAEAVYAQLADFHAWQAWSPWEKLDPGMKKTFEGAPGAVGSNYAWAGNDEVGSGKMTITEARPPTSITMRLDFIEPFAATATNGFKLAPSGDGVNVTWWMDGTNDFMGKLFGMFMDMDAMIGADFERGLDQLEAVAETQAQKHTLPAPAAVAPAAAAGTAQAQEPPGATP